MKNKRIGLALGGGAVLGAAHIGVLKALKENDITIDFISGTSIGALVSALVAFGNDCDDLKEIVLKMSWGDVSSFSFSKYGLFSNDKIGDFIHKNIGDVTIESAKIPLAIIATDISTGDKVILEEGSVSDAVKASACIPGIFQPIKMKGRLLVDGGIVENVPISPLRELGAEYIIAVDLISKHRNIKPKNIIDVLLNSFQYTLTTAAKLQTRKADLLIQPDLSSFNYLDASQTVQIMQLGYNEAIKVLNGLD